MSTVAEKPAPVADETKPSTAQEIEHEHYDEIREKTDEVCRLRTKWVAAKDKAKNAKGEFDGANTELIELIQRGPDPQRKLPLEGDAAATGKPSPANDAWRTVTLDHLDIKPGLVTKLAEHGLENLGQLSDYWWDRHVLTELAGIGESKDEAVRDAFAKYGVEHPEVFETQDAVEQPAEGAGPKPAEETASEADGGTDSGTDDWTEEDDEDDEDDDWDDEDDDEL